MTQKQLRLELLLVMIGLLLEGIAVLHLRPATFLLFLWVGAPALVAGVALFAWRMWRHYGERDAY